MKFPLFLIDHDTTNYPYPFYRGHMLRKGLSAYNKNKNKINKKKHKQKNPNKKQEERPK